MRISKRLVLRFLLSFLVILTIKYFLSPASKEFDPTIPNEQKLLIYEKMIKAMQEQHQDYCSTEGYCRRPETRHINCKRVLDGDRTYISSVTGVNRVPLIPNPFLDMTCESISSRIKSRHQMRSLSQGGIAFANIVYMDYEFIEKQVQMTWHPENRWCFVIDKKAEKIFKLKMRKLVNCFENQMILMPVTLHLDSAGHNQNLGHTQCMKALLKHPHWSYLILLQNHDIITKTVYELDQIFEILGGVNDVEMREVLGERVMEGKNWDPKNLKLFRNESLIPENVLQEPLKISTGSAEATVSRAAVKWLIETVDLTKFIEQQNELKYGADEQFISTFQINPQLGMPGHFTNHCLTSKTPQITRMAQFAFNNPEKCGTKTIRHNACLFGIEDMKAMVEMPYLIWNKVYPSFDWSIVDCIGEFLFNKTFIGESKLDLAYYKELVTVNYHKNHEVNCTLKRRIKAYKNYL